MATPVIPPFDDAVFHALFDTHHGALGTVAAAFSGAGGGWGMLAIIPLLVRPRTRRFARWLVATLAGTGTLVWLLKIAVGRGRPYTIYDALRTALEGSPVDHSFPSGHAAGSFAFALFVTRTLLDRRPRPPFARTGTVAAVLFASCVGVSRVVLGYHFPTDVLGGAILGGVIGGLAGRRFARV